MSTKKMKQDVHLSELNEIFQKHNLGSVINAEPMTGGEFNSVYKVQTDDERQYVIKIAPPENVNVLTYEKNLIKSEAMVYEKLACLNTIHIPEVFAYSRDEGYHYLIMEFIDGETLLKVKLSEKEKNEVMYKLGQAVAEIHSLENSEGFGYRQNGFYETWRQAYLGMIENMIRDAERKNVKIPYLDEIQNLINQNLHVLDEVEKPSLVHFDLWAGNIILKDNKLYSVIDCERAMYGDRMGDFISLDYLTPFSVEKNKALIDGYNSVATQKLNFNKNQMIRLYLMRLYLCLIVNVEIYYRYPKKSFNFWGRYKFSKMMIKVTIKEIKKYTDL